MDRPWTAAEVAERAGVDETYVGRLVELGVITAAVSPTVDGAARRVGIVGQLERGGLPLPAIAEALRMGALSLDFVDQPDYERFASLSDVTFAAASERSGVPVPVLLAVREAMGGLRPEPTDRMRDDELAVVSMLEVQCRMRIRPDTLELALRTMGESLRRMAETEADWWNEQVIGPVMAAGGDIMEMADLQNGAAAGLSEATDKAILAIFHGQQASAWMRNIFEGTAATLVEKGLHTPSEAIPAMCFLDLTGYSRLTDERGDKAAAELADRLARIAQRTSTKHRGKAVKWLGDGVMFYFPDPGDGVLAALEMVQEAREADLPPAHVGLHAGPVLFQGGDYFGGTVNAASRIADYARQGEVLVSRQVVDLAGDIDVSFVEIGPVELKGLGDSLHLFMARRGRAA